MFDIRSMKSTTFSSSAALFFILACTPASSAIADSEADLWSTFRGPAASGSSSKGLLPSGDFGLTVDWQKEVGTGYSNVSVADGKIYTAFSSGDIDVVAAFNAATGSELWRYELAKKYVGHDGSDNGPLSTPTIDRGVVYFVGPRGQVVALDSETGKRHWQFDLNEENSTVPFYGYTTSPVVAGDQVILATGGEGHGFTALDRLNGEPKWTSGSDKAEYQTPSLVEIDGRELLIAVTHQLVQGLEVDTGKILWQMQHSEAAADESSSHAVLAPGGRFLINLQTGSKFYRATTNSVELLWESRAFGRTLAIPEAVGDHFYGFSGNILTCVEMSTGKIVWRTRELSGQGMALVDGVLAVLSSEAIRRPSFVVNGFSGSGTGVS